MTNTEINAVCRFCGQVLVTDEVFDTAEAACEWASRSCKCEDAVRYNEIENSKARARELLNELDDKQKDLVCWAIAAVGFGKVESVTVKINGIYTVKISINGSGRLVCKVTDKKTSQFEL